MKNKVVLKLDILKILPNTQCGKCGLKTCADFAEALVKNEGSVNDCPPGGEEVRRNLAKVLAIKLDPAGILHKKENALVAFVKEDYCIGCTKCLAACPMDAIIGAKGKAHTVVREWCTGCELCALVCPTDCIDFYARPSGIRELSKEDSGARFMEKTIRDDKFRNLEQKSSGFVSVDDVSKKELGKTI